MRLFSPVLFTLVEYAPFLSLEMPSVFRCDVWEPFFRYNLTGPYSYIGRLFFSLYTAILKAVFVGRFAGRRAGTFAGRTADTFAGQFV